MESLAKTTTVNVIPTLRYNDSKAAVEWLCKAFGLEKRLHVPGEDETVIHAQLVFGTGMVMVGQTREAEFDDLQKSPRDLGGVVSQSAYIVVEDADKHYKNAVNAGAEIAYDIRDEDFGGRGYSYRDPEGHLWNFGTYDPWAE